MYYVFKCVYFLETIQIRKYDEISHFLYKHNDRVIHQKHNHQVLFVISTGGRLNTWYSLTSAGPLVIKMARSLTRIFLIKRVSILGMTVYISLLYKQRTATVFQNIVTHLIKHNVILYWCIAITSHESHVVTSHRSWDGFFNSLCGPTSTNYQSQSASLALCEGNSSVTGELPTQGASNAENASIWCRYHELTMEWVNGNLLYEITQGVDKYWLGIWRNPIYLVTDAI